MNRPALVELSLARWRSFYREPSVLFWTFGFPLLLSVVLGLAFRNRPPEPVFAAVEDGAHARETLALFDQGDVRGEVMSHDDAERALRSGRVAIVVTGGDDASRTYRFDPTRPESRLARALVDDEIQRGLGRTPIGKSKDEIVSEPGARYVDFLIPGLIGSGLMSSGLWGLGYGLVEMRTKKLLKRLYATPMSRVDFLLSFLVTRAVFVFVEIPVLVAFGYLAFGVPLRGSLALLFALCLAGSLVFAGMGLLVAARAKNTQTVSGLINLASFPMYLVSGVFFSSARFPDAMQPFIKALPLTALNDSLRAVMLDGAGPRAVLAPAAVLLAWGVGCFVVALRTFRWNG